MLFTLANVFAQAAEMKARPLEDRIVNGVVGAARGGWKTVKFIAPIAGRIGVKLAKRAGKAVARNRTVRKAASSALDSAVSKKGAESLFKQILFGLWR